MVQGINRSFVYGVSVSGDNFTDRIKETRRLKMDFENGLNVVLISPRRMGKTSLMKKVQQVVNPSIVHIVYMDIYDCKLEYDFCNKFAESVLKQTSDRMDTSSPTHHGAMVEIQTLNSKYRKSDKVLQHFA